MKMAALIDVCPTKLQKHLKLNAGRGAVDKKGWYNYNGPYLAKDSKVNKVGKCE